MKALYDLKDKLQEELEEIARKPEMSAGDLETVHKLTDTVKNIDKICMLEDGEGGYSRNGNYGYAMEGDRSPRDTYGRGSSYARKRDSMGRYSRTGDVIAKLHELMDGATTERERLALKRAIDQIEM